MKIEIPSLSEKLTNHTQQGLNLLKMRIMWLEFVVYVLIIVVSNFHEFLRMISNGHGVRDHSRFIFSINESISQQTFTSSNSTIQRLEKSVKHSKLTIKTTSKTSFSCFYC